MELILLATAVVVDFGLDFLAPFFERTIRWVKMQIEIQLHTWS